MTLPVAIMYVVAAIIGVVALGLLLALRRPRSAAQVYALRMSGIMAASGAIVLAMSATAMWRWSTQS